MKIVYIAGPYTHGNVEENVAAAIEMAVSILKMGYSPFCPHLYHFIEKTYPQPYQTWIDIDNAFVNIADAMIVLPGLSPGTRAEEKLAAEIGIPVFNSLEELAAGSHLLEKIPVH